MAEEEQDKLKEVFANPVLQKAVVDQVFRNRPKGWTSKSTATYYKERYGQEMKEYFDALMKNRGRCIFSYKTFEAMGKSRQSVYTYVNQAIRYLLEMMDDDKDTYKRFREMLRVERSKELGGVVIEVRPEFRNSDVSSIKPTFIEPKTEIPSWKSEMETFVEEGKEGGQFHKENLILTDEDVKWIKESLMGCKTIMSSITHKSIKLIKTGYKV